MPLPMGPLWVFCPGPTMLWSSCSRGFSDTSGGCSGLPCLLQTPNPAPSFDSGFRPRCPLGFGVLVTLSHPAGVSGAAGPMVRHLKGCLTARAMRLRAILSVPQGPGDTGSGVCVQSRGFGKAPRLKPGPCHVVPGVPKPLDSAVRAGTSSEALPPAQRYASRQLCVTAASATVHETR